MKRTIVKSVAVSSQRGSFLSTSGTMDPLSTSCLGKQRWEGRRPLNCTLGRWREFGCRDDANAWRKYTKEADKHKISYCNLESKNLSMHLCNHRTNSHQSSSA